MHAYYWHYSITPYFSAHLLHTSPYSSILLEKYTPFNGMCIMSENILLTQYCHSTSCYITTPHFCTFLHITLIYAPFNGHRHHACIHTSPHSSILLRHTHPSTAKRTMRAIILLTKHHHSTFLHITTSPPPYYFVIRIIRASMQLSQHCYSHM